MTWRAPLALILALVLALASQTMAVARTHAAQPGMTMVICSGYGVTTVTLDAEGNPTGPVHPCPDCLSGLSLAPPAATVTPAAPRTRADTAALPPLAITPPAFWPAAPARGPPLSA
jgi:hypothetical protein